MDSIGHELRKDEKAVDLTAMILGFRRSYINMHGDRTLHRFGYLTSREVELANKLIRSMSPRQSSAHWPEIDWRLVIGGILLGLLLGLSVLGIGEILRSAGAIGGG